MTDTIGPMTRTGQGTVLSQESQRLLAEELVEQARAEGAELIGPGGLLTGLTKTVLQTALEEELSAHLGYDKHDPVGRTGTTPATGPGRRRSSPTSARSPWRCHETATAPSTR